MGVEVDSQDTHKDLLNKYVQSHDPQAVAARVVESRPVAREWRAPHSLLCVREVLEVMESRSKAGSNNPLFIHLR